MGELLDKHGKSNLEELAEDTYSLAQHTSGEGNKNIIRATAHQILAMAKIDASNNRVSQNQQDLAFAQMGLAFAAGLTAAWLTLFGANTSYVGKMIIFVIVAAGFGYFAIVPLMNILKRERKHLEELKNGYSRK